VQAVNGGALRYGAQEAKSQRFSGRREAHYYRAELYTKVSGPAHSPMPVGGVLGSVRVRLGPRTHLGRLQAAGPHEVQHGYHQTVHVHLVAEDVGQEAVVLIQELPQQHQDLLVAPHLPTHTQGHGKRRVMVSSVNARNIYLLQHIRCAG
jgi:hypothetical protein